VHNRRYDRPVAGHVISYQEEDRYEVSYWLGKKFLGRGIASQSLTEFLAHTQTARPTHARLAKDNIASHRVLEESAFTVKGESKGFANAPGKEIEE
jgi:RimJ/RimL family protein N-acetyltransferase